MAANRGKEHGQNQHDHSSQHAASKNAHPAHHQHTDSHGAHQAHHHAAHHAANGLKKYLPQIALLAVLIVAVFFFLQGNRIPGMQPPQEGKDIAIITITAPGCLECSSLNTQLGPVMTEANLRFDEKNYAYNSKEGKELVAKYGIKKAPAAIITGKIDNLTSTIGWIKKPDALLFANPALPYYDIEMGKRVGVVEATIVAAKSCTQCSDITQLVAALKNNGMVFGKQVTYDIGSKEGKDIAAKYGLDFAPFAVFSEDFAAYENMAAQWSRIGKVQDGKYVFTLKVPPYYDFAQNRTRGILSMIVLKDAKCANCSDMSLFKTSLEGAGVKIAELKKYDISEKEGQELAAKYSVKALPTFFLVGDWQAYGEQFEGNLRQGGTVEQDNTFVFRNYEIIVPAPVYEPYETGNAAPKSQEGQIGITILPK
ncbi:hypothetical protein FJZ26_01870 [Candidatus Parvarchaeota archaeon]|nr:hypothetical protein [Candidatus Parvarchaeota archaeon]